MVRKTNPIEEKITQLENGLYKGSHVNDTQYGELSQKKNKCISISLKSGFLHYIESVKSLDIKT